MIQILKVKNKNGEWVSIPAIKGDKGEKGEKGEQGERGAQGLKGEKGDPFTYEDFTAEQLANLKGKDGTNGIWTYCIWSSGISECWGKQSISVTTSTSNNGYYTGSVGSLQYPSNLFISEPVLNCTLKASGFPGHLFIDGTESSSYTGKISIAAHSNTTVNGYIHLSAKGRWK